MLPGCRTRARLDSQGKVDSLRHKHYGLACARAVAACAECPVKRAMAAAQTLQNAGKAAGLHKKNRMADRILDQRALMCSEFVCSLSGEATTPNRFVPSCPCCGGWSYLEYFRVFVPPLQPQDLFGARPQQLFDLRAVCSDIHNAYRESTVYSENQFPSASAWTTEPWNQPWVCFGGCGHLSRLVASLSTRYDRDGH